MNIETIKSKIIAKEYQLVRNPNKRLTSNVWESMYCIMDQNNVQMENYVACNKCNSVLKQSKDGSTKNLITHINKCSVKNSLTKPTTIVQLMAVHKGIKPEHKELIVASLSKMSVLDFRPFSTCSGLGFRLYSQSIIDIAAKIGKFNIDDILPVSTTVSRNVTELYKRALISTKRNIKDSYQHSPLGFSATTDHWTCKWSSICNTSFTVHYITRDWTLRNHLLALKRYPSKNEDGSFRGKTAEEQVDVVEKIIESLDVFEGNALTFVTDSEPVQIATIKKLNLPHLPCLAHKLNTVLQTFFEKKNSQCPKTILNTVKSCKGIVTHYKEGFHMDLLETTLKQNGDTRWNSHLTMFKSIVKNWDAIELSVDQVDNKNEDVRSLFEQIRYEELIGIIEILEVWKTLILGI
jgi:hypothetical protein